APRVPRDVRATRIGRLDRVRPVGGVVGRGNDHRARGRQHGADVGAFVGGSMEVPHLSGVPAVEPLAEEFQFWKIACGSDAAPIETKLARAGLDRSRVQTGADGRWLMANGKWMSISLEPSAMSHYLVLADQLPQYVRQDAAVTEGDEFFRRVDASDRLKFDRLPIVAHGTNGDRSARFEALCDADEFERLAPGDAERRGGLSCFELQREDTHVHEVAAVDALEG